jgi:membrane protein DedA with SNARE-associated domain
MAGITRMPWWRFLFWNAAGGIVWAAAVGLISFYAGRAVADTFARWGVYGAIGGAIVLVAVLVGLHFWRRRMVEKT